MRMTGLKTPSKSRRITNAEGYTNTSVLIANVDEGKSLIPSPSPVEKGAKPTAFSARL
jgi:hypothetical protein